jgi:RNA-directed DNA polymerase
MECALGIPTMTDRAMQVLYLLALDPVAETTADPNSYGFRRERSTADAMEQCFVALARQESAAWVLEGDIKACFERISHDWLVAHIPMERVMLRKWLKAGYVERQVLYPTDDGTPQGGPISPVLANLTLDGIERRLREQYPKPKVGYNAKVNLARYADDFIITGRSRELLEDEVRPLVERFLRERGLELSLEKTTVTHIADGFDFLGHTVRKYRGKLLITPSRKSVKVFLGKVRGIIKGHKHATAGQLIVWLNPLIRGWVMYYRHQVSKKTFHAVDHALFLCLWRWAKRRHPKKRAWWVKAKYFPRHGGRSWVFSGEAPDAGGKSRRVQLFAASSVLIKRHTKIRGEANPYDPAWDDYFARRHGAQMAAALDERRTVLQLWRAQRGRCPVCDQALATPDAWHNHHIVARADGGSDAPANRVLLHPMCHQQVHHQQRTVEQPRLARGE